MRAPVEYPVIQNIRERSRIAQGSGCLQPFAGFACRRAQSIESAWTSTSGRSLQDASAPASCAIFVPAGVTTIAQNVGRRTALRLSELPTSGVQMRTQTSFWSVPGPRGLQSQHARTLWNLFGQRRVITICRSGVSMGKSRSPRVLNYCPAHPVAESVFTETRSSQDRIYQLVFDLNRRLAWSSSLLYWSRGFVIAFLAASRSRGFNRSMLLRRPGMRL